MVPAAVHDETAPRRLADSKLARGIALLDTFRPGDATLMLKQLTARAGLATGTAHRISRELAELGMLDRVPGGFRPGWALARLALRATTWPALTAAAGPAAERLHALSGCPVTLYVPSGGGLLPMWQVTSARGITEFRPVPPAGDVSPLLPELARRGTAEYTSGGRPMLLAAIRNGAAAGNGSASCDSAGTRNGTATRNRAAAADGSAGCESTATRNRAAAGNGSAGCDSAGTRNGASAGDAAGGLVAVLGMAADGGGRLYRFGPALVAAAREAARALPLFPAPAVAPPRGQPGTGVLARGVGLLGCLRPGERAVRRLDVVERAATPRSTVYRCLDELLRGELLADHDGLLGLGRLARRLAPVAVAPRLPAGDPVRALAGSGGITCWLTPVDPDLGVPLNGVVLRSCRDGPGTAGSRWAEWDVVTHAVAAAVRGHRPARAPGGPHAVAVPLRLGGLTACLTVVTEGARLPLAERLLRQYADPHALSA